MEDVNWEEKYWDLVGAVALEKAEKARRKREREFQFQEVIAPEDADLPIIMRMCTPEERAELAVLVSQKIVDGAWTGNVTGRGGSKRPSLQYETALSRRHASEGKRKVTYVDKRTGKSYTGKANCTFIVTHVVLVAAGKFPTEKQNHASHLCHDNICVNVDHLVWEASSDNNRRERLCRKEKKCICGLKPPCIFE